MKLKVKLIHILVLSFFCVGILSACTGQVNESEENGHDAESVGTQTLTNIQPEYESLDDWIDSLESQEKSISSFGTEQYLNDFDYLYGQLKENYAFFGVARRKAGMDLDERYIQARDKIEQCDNDIDFIKIINEDFLPTPLIGHLSMFGYERYFDYLEDAKESIELYPDYADVNRPYLEALDNENSIAYYEKLQNFYEKQDAAYKQYSDNKGIADLQAGSEKEESPNVITEIIEEGRIAYAYIHTLDMKTYEEDKEKLFQFYKEVADYDHLIFDITDNGGGGMGYFIDLMLLPNIDKTMETKAYAFYKRGKNNMKFLSWLEGDDIIPISEMPELPDFNEDDKEELDCFSVIEGFPYKIEPEYEEKMFKGKIWMLISEKVYSSAEYTAMFSKNTGFATLVGTQTGGDGIGTSPVYIVLPNTGLVVRYSPVYGTTEDGKNSEEFGTQPHILSKENETALETCLNAIKEMDK